MIQKINSFEEYAKEYAHSVTEPDNFWADKANTFRWKEKWDQVLDWEFNTPKVSWFTNGKLNITENCIDRHLEEKGNKTAIIWEPNNPEEQESVKITFQELHDRVNQAANALTELGIKKGDRVCLYMPMIPELAVSVLACARVGAIHSVVFAGFSAKALSDRINDSACKLIITADGSYRGKKYIDLKTLVNEALKSCPSIEHCLVVRHSRKHIEWYEKDVWWHEKVDNQSSGFDAVEVDSEDPLFILYTSGSTGKPKGVVHTTGGYMVYAEYSFRNVFQYNEGDIFWCTADIGWITGHSYLVYGPLLSGATTVMFEGVPTFPDAGRFWDVVDKHQVNIFYTAPTAIRALEAHDIEFVNKHDLSSLKVLGTVGEPINEEAWHWYHKNVGKENCPIVDTYWQTETGGIMISPLGNLWNQKPTCATFPLPGIQPIILDQFGKEIKGNNLEGNLCFKYPWPSMIRSTWGDHERCRKVYFSSFKGYYFTGDGCKRDSDGMYRITGRVDDVINVSGHRIGTAEIEDAIDEHPNVIESAVVGFPHDIKGQGIMAYVILEHQIEELASSTLFKQINEKIIEHIGPIAKPDQIIIVEDLPKTRSGKIMRRILRKVASRDVDNIGDTSTLLNPETVAKIIESM